MSRRRSAGVALITALLVVALATLAATALLSSTNLSIRRAGAVQEGEQAWWVARGVNAWVIGILDADRRETGYDGLDEAWSQPVDYLPVTDQGFLRGRVEDLRGRLNLNALSAKQPRKLEQFRRLLQALPGQEPPPGLVDAIQDWIDADTTPLSMNGAEDADYLSLTPPYRSANRPFAAVSELRAVRGVTPKLYEALRPLVTALPEDPNTARASRVNVNTAPEAVLRALGQVDEAKLRAFVERRAEDPVRDQAGLDTLLRDGPWTVGGEVKDHVTWKSNYFLVQGEVFVGSSRVALYSLIHRPDNGPPVVLAHSAEAD